MRRGEPICFKYFLNSNLKTYTNTVMCYILLPGRRHTLDPVALAALASREDFSRVSLRKTKGPGKEKGEFDGSLPVMLLQIKGKFGNTNVYFSVLVRLNLDDKFVIFSLLTTQLVS